LARSSTPGRRLPQLQTSAAAGDRAPAGIILAFGLVIALRFGGRSIGGTFFNVYLDQGLGVSTALIGAIAAAGQLLSVPLALAAPPLLARWGTGGYLVRGIWAMAVTMLPVALVPHWLAAGVGFAGLTALFSATIGSVRLFSQEVVAPRWRTASAAAFMTGGGVGQAAVSVAGGYTIATLGYQPLFLAATGLIAASGLLFEGYFRRWRRPVQPGTAAGGAEQSGVVAPHRARGEPE
jgi:predicted MFS family arabinose efflux permease